MGSSTILIEQESLSSPRDFWIKDDASVRTSKNVYAGDIIKASLDNQVNKIKEESARNDLKTQGSIFDSLEENVFKVPKYNFEKAEKDSKNFATSVQRWKGYITNVSNGIFIAKLEDITESGTYETGQFEIREISPEDQELIVKGAVFYWSIGHFMENGQITKRSLVRFQRLIEWSSADYDSATDRIDNIYNNINWV